MGLWERLSVAVILTGVGCGDADAGNDGESRDASQSQAMGWDGGPNFDANALLPTIDASRTDGASNNADARSGSSDTDASVLVLEIPTSAVPCGGSMCETLEKVCCSSWSRNTGFGSEQTCVARTDCYGRFGRSGESNRAVTQECDGKEDCSAGQVCCVYADGQPLFAGLGTTELEGPGGSTICSDIADCTYNNTGTFIAAGIPLGELQCNDDTDCSDRAGSSCQAELANSHSTGARVPARPGVKVCR